ncbi:MAG TPA: hypothetical protein VNG71_06370 [Pyrinomonadaceae bacterium]|nr:hypothetical protein [Pyrinomonadaceae bacterium]
MLIELKGSEFAVSGTSLNSARVFAKGRPDDRDGSDDRDDGRPEGGGDMTPGGPHGPIRPKPPNILSGLEQ